MFHGPGVIQLLAAKEFQAKDDAKCAACSSIMSFWKRFWAFLTCFLRPSSSSNSHALGVASMSDIRRPERSQPMLLNQSWMQKVNNKTTMCDQVWFVIQLKVGAAISIEEVQRVESTDSAVIDGQRGMVQDG